jgi:hypothetical protein
MKTDFESKKSIGLGLDCGMIGDSYGAVERGGFGRIWKAAAIGSYRHITAVRKYFFGRVDVCGKWHLKAIRNFCCELVFEGHRRAQ